MRPVPVVRPITAVPIGRPIATTEPNAISRMIIAASKPISSDLPVLGLRAPRRVLAADLRVQVGGADIVEGGLEPIERHGPQVDGRLVVGDLCVPDRAVGRQGAGRLERVRDRDDVRLTLDGVQRGVHGVGLALERPTGRVEDEVRRGAGGGGVPLGQQVVGALRLGVRQLEVVAELAAEGAADHEDRDHGGDPDPEGAPTVARCRLAEPIEERTQGLTFRRNGRGRPTAYVNQMTPDQAESSLSIRASRKPSDAAAGTTPATTERTRRWTWHRNGPDTDGSGRRGGIY